MLYKCLILLSISFLLCSCASYIPVSEGIIYHDQDEEPYSVKHALPFVHGENGFTLSYMVLPKVLREQVRITYEENLSGDNEVVFKNHFLIAPPVPAVSLPLARKVALGFSILPLYPGLDVTTNLFEDFWITGSVQSPLFAKLNTEFILQRPVYRVPNGGISVGLFYRYNHLSYFSKGEQISLSDLVAYTFPLKWYGGRITAQIPDNQLNTRFRFHFNGGYSSMYDSALFTFGIGISFRPQPRIRSHDPIRF